MYHMPKVFMADGGTHFSSHEVADWCTKHGSWYHKATAYSLWVNGLLEGTNMKLLSWLKHLCTLKLSEDDWEKITSFGDLPGNWPMFVDTAVEQLNKQILPAYKFSPGSKMPLEISCEELVEADIRIQN